MTGRRATVSLSRHACVARGTITGVLLAVCAFRTPAVATETYYPPPESKGGWRTLVTKNAVPTMEQKGAVLATAGLDTDRLVDAWKYVESLGRQQSLLIIRHGWIAGEWDYVGRGPVNSSTKSLTGLALAKLFELSDAGRLPRKIGYDDFAYHYLPAAWGDSDPRKKLIKVRDLPTMCSGLEAMDRGIRDVNMALALPVVHPPETVDQYSSASTMLEGMVIERASGQSLKDFFRQYLSEPIGTESVRLWDAHGAAGYAFMHTRDFARLGYLMLHQGAWDNGSGVRQLIRPDLIAKCTQWPPFLANVTDGPGNNTQWLTPNDPPSHFLHTWHGWWVNWSPDWPASQRPVWPFVPKDAFWMSGYGKDICVVIPSLDMVIAHQTARTGKLEQVLSECPEFCSMLLAKVMAAVAEKTHTALPSSYRIEQITTGPRHHFYGYQGHAGNTPFNAGGTHLVLLETAFQDRMVEKTDAADIVLVDLATKDKTTLTQTHAWNFQQGTMMYRNPLAPDEEIIFNDRDPGTDKIKTVLFNVKTKRLVKEWFFPATPFGNSGVAQQGGKFLGINYGRLDRLRRITGYAGAHDWTVGVKCPANDGIWRVDTATGAETLLLSFEQLRDLFVAQTPDIARYDLFINHTLWNRDDTRFLAAVRWFDSEHKLRSIWFTCRSDGTDVTAFPVDPGHPDWDAGTNLTTGRGVVYETRTTKLVETIDKAFFTYDGDLSISRDRSWLASNDFKRNPDRKTQDVRVLIYSRAAHAGMRLPWYSRGVYFSNNREDYRDDNRIDVSPCWNRDGTKIYFVALADDGTRQAFVVHLTWESPAP